MPNNAGLWTSTLEILGAVAALLTIGATGYLFRDWLTHVLRIRLPIHELQKAMYREIPVFNATLQRHYVRYGGPRPGRSRECFAFAHARETRAYEHVMLTIRSKTLFRFEAYISHPREEENAILEGRWVRDSEGRHWATQTTPGATPQRKTTAEVCWETLERLLKEAEGERDATKRLKR